MLSECAPGTFEFGGEAAGCEHVTHDCGVLNIEQVRAAFNKLQMDEPGVKTSEIYDQDNDGDTCLHIAIILRDPDVALKLVAMVPDPGMLDVSNNLSQTPLYLAVLTNQLAVVRHLIADGVCLQSRDREGNTPLHIACREGYYEIVIALLTPLKTSDSEISEEHSPDVEQFLELKNYHGETALHLAGVHFHADTLRLLINSGADINAVFSKTGNTILHEAALSGNMALTTLLLGCKNCDINARAFDGSTPFDLARSHHRSDVVRLLASAGAKLNEDV